MARIRSRLESLVMGEARGRDLDDRTGLAGLEASERRRFPEDIPGEDGHVRLEHRHVVQAQRRFDIDGQIMRERARNRAGERRLDALMRDTFGRRHDDVPPDQLESLVLVEDAGRDHATDVLDGERSSGDPSGGCGDGDVHGSDHVAMRRI